GELDDLARAVDELRVGMMREKAWSAERLETMRKIAAGLGEGLLALNAKRRIVMANDSVARMFGMSGQLVGRPLLEVVRNTSPIAAFDKAMSGAASADRITTSDDRGERQIEIRVFPVAASEVAVVALCIDVLESDRL